jgi:hypothetical protein
LGWRSHCFGVAKGKPVCLVDMKIEKLLDYTYE